MIETWKDITDYQGSYQVSDLGRVRSLKRENPQILSQSLNGKGYLKIQLWKHGRGKTFETHRLVALAFLGACPDGMEVRHIKPGRLNNAASNLIYVTPSDNNKDKRGHGTHKTQNRIVVRGDGKRFGSLTQAAKDSGICVSGITKVCQGTQKTAGGWHWQYGSKPGGGWS